MSSRSMRLSFIVFCLVAFAGASALWGDPPNRAGRLNFISGAVSFHPESVDEWAPATLNYPSSIGDSLWTDKGGQAEVHVGSTAIRLASNTEITFLNLNDQTIQIRLSVGSLNVRLRHLAGGEQIELDTPNSSLSLLRAGTYRIDVQESGDTSVTARAGEVEVTAGSSVFPLRFGQTVEVTGLDSPRSQVSEAVPMDDWDRWCEARDLREDKVASAQYVSRDAISGVEDLDEYGSWSQDPDLGPVWTPTVVVVGWAPYRFGHWAWVDPWGWTWIDDAPWGFAPFHCGRWAFRNTLWVWVPGPYMTRPYYAPALVTFVGGGGWHASVTPGGSIGWFPLGPHEPYMAPYGTNRTRFEFEHFPFVNRNVPGAVTVVSGESFVRGQPAAAGALVMRADDFERAPVRGAVAPLVPQRESVFGGSLSARGPVSRPPALVTTRPVVARLTPPPPAPSFTERAPALAARPGHPVDPTTLLDMKRQGPAVRPQVNVVNPGLPRSTVGQPIFPLRDPERRVPPGVNGGRNGPIEYPPRGQPRSSSRDVMPQQPSSGYPGTALQPQGPVPDRERRFSPAVPQFQAPSIRGDDRRTPAPDTGNPRPSGRTRGPMDDDLLIPRQGTQ